MLILLLLAVVVERIVAEEVLRVTPVWCEIIIHCVKSLTNIIGRVRKLQIGVRCVAATEGLVLRAQADIVLINENVFIQHLRVSCVEKVRIKVLLQAILEA